MYLSMWEQLKVLAVDFDYLIACPITSQQMFTHSLWQSHFEKFLIHDHADPDRPQY
jgi:hypothetical protein